MGLISLLKSGVYLDLHFYKNNRANFIMSLVWPYLILVLMLGAGLLLGSEQNFKANVGMDVNPLLFFVASTYVVTISLNVMWEVGGSVLFYRWVGVLPYIFLSPHRPSTVLVLGYLPRYLVNSLISLMEFVPIIILTEGLSEGVLDTGVLVFAMLVGMLPLLGFASILASFLITSREESNFMSWLNPLILIISGAYYPAYLFPAWMQLISRLLPTTVALDLARVAALFNTDLKHVMFLSGILLGMAIFYNGISLPMIERSERKALKEGAIDVY